MQGRRARFKRQRETNLYRRCLTIVPFTISIRNSPTLTVAYAGRLYPDARCFQNVWYYVDMAGLIVRFRMQHAVQALPSAALRKEAAATS
jgi:hypothetical protein